MDKDKLLALLKEHLTVSIWSSASSTQDGEATIDTEISIYFDGELIAEARS